jgi:type VI protein secretion system component Hcp
VYFRSLLGPLLNHIHALASAQHVPQCIVTVETIVLTLSNCLIESISEVFEADAPAPLETIVLSFGRVVLEYFTKSPTGSFETPVTASWDITTNSTV